MTDRSRMTGGRVVPGSIALVLVLLTAVLSVVIRVGTTSPARTPRAQGAAACRDCNVMIVLFDALRPDHLGCYGYPEDTSPNIDAFAASAYRFERMIAVSSWTRPSTASILTGRYPKNHGFVALDSRLPDGEITLQEILAGSGYFTAGFLNSWVLGERTNLAQGFQKVSATGGYGRHIPGSSTITDDVIGTLNGIGALKNFIYVHYMDTHKPYKDPRVPSASGEGKAGGEKATTDGNSMESYDAAIRHNDEQLGRLFEALRRKGMWDRSIIVVTADHGEAFGEHGSFGHFTSLYDEEIRVPFIMRMPGAREGVVVGVASQVDIMPTLLSALGLPIPEGIDGIDLSSGERGLAFSELIDKAAVAVKEEFFLLRWR